MFNAHIAFKFWKVVHDLRVPVDRRQDKMYFLISSLQQLLLIFACTSVSVIHDTSLRRYQLGHTLV